MKQRGYIQSRIRSRGGSNLIIPPAGFVYDIPDWYAEFADAGSGAVTTTLTRGSGLATFTRATTATTIGSTGLVLKGIASGTARSRYDPTSLAYQGYFAEGARTNICLQSEDLATTWTNSRSTESVNATTAPDGTSTADKLVEDATAANTHFISQSITYTAAVYTFSVWLKAGERTWARILMNDGTTVVSSYYDLTLGAVGTQANGTGTIKAYPDGWYRCMVTSTAAMAAAAGSISILLAEADNDQTFDGDGTSGIYVWGAQVEAGSFASSYIPTTTASVTRNADVLTYPFILNAGRGTFYAELSTLWTSSPNAVAATGGGTNSHLLIVGTAAASTVITTRDGTTVVTKTGLTDMNTGVRKRAASWGALGQFATGDGAAVASGLFDGAHDASALAIGQVTPSGAANWFGTIKNARGWLAQASAAQLQSITS